MDCLTLRFCKKVAAANVFPTPKYMRIQGLSLKFTWWLGKKEKVPNVSDPNQNVERKWNFKLKFT